MPSYVSEPISRHSSGPFIIDGASKFSCKIWCYRGDWLSTFD